MNEFFDDRQESTSGGIKRVNLENPQPVAGESERKRILRENIHVDEFVLNGTPVRVIGVKHFPETFDAIPDFWESEFGRSSTILRETLPHADGWNTAFEMEARSLYDELTHDERAGLSFDEFKANNFGGIVFSTRLEEMAYAMGKTVVCADPISGDKAAYDRLAEADVHMREAKEKGRSMAFGITGLLLALAGAESAKDKRISRRTLIQLAGGAISAGAFAALSKSRSYDAPEDLPFSIGATHSGESPFEQFIFHALDYRMVCAGLAIDRLTHMFPGKPLTFVYGLIRTPAIRRYAEHPTEARVRARLYRATYGVEVPARLRVYKPASQDEGVPQWTLAVDELL